MFVRTNLTDKFSKLNGKMFSLFNEKGERVNIFRIDTNRLNIENIKKEAMDIISYKSDASMFEFYNLDFYSPEIVVLFRKNNKIEKYLIANASID